MNENNSMAYTQNDDAKNDSLQNHSVYAQDNTSSVPESGTAATKDILSSAPENGIATAQNVPSSAPENGAAAQDISSSAPEGGTAATQNNTTQSSIFSGQDNADSISPMSNQDSNVQDSTPAAQNNPICLQKENASIEPLQNNLTYPQNNPMQDSCPQNDPTYTQNITAPANPAYAQNNATQYNPAAYAQNNVTQYTPAYAQNNTTQSNSAYTQNNNMQSDLGYTQNSTTQGNPAYTQSSAAQGNPTAAMAYSNTPLLQLNDLCKRYPGMGTYMSVFHMNLIIPRGRIIGLLGPNGCGKTTLIKMINGLLAPTCGNVLINGMEPGPATKKIISYLPERTYLDNSMKVSQMVTYFADFYEDFSTEKAYGMLGALGISSDARLKTLSKGTKEKVQLILVMSRQADLYILDEPIAGVDPAARDYILRTIITNYNPSSTIILSTHLISDIENILDDVIFMKNGSLMLYTSVDSIRSQMGKSVDTYFREVYAC